VAVGHRDQLRVISETGDRLGVVRADHAAAKNAKADTFSQTDFSSLHNEAQRRATASSVRQRRERMIPRMPAGSDVLRNMSALLIVPDIDRRKTARRPRPIDDVLYKRYFGLSVGRHVVRMGDGQRVCQSSIERSSVRRVALLLCG
jgi:hypothetical protein